MAMWVKVDDFVTTDAFFGGYGSFGSYGESYFMGAAGKYLVITNWGEGTGISRLEPGRWYHIAAATDQKSTSLYLDGVLIKTAILKIHPTPDTQFYSGSIVVQDIDTRRLKGAVD